MTQSGICAWIKLIKTSLKCFKRKICLHFVRWVLHGNEESPVRQESENASLEWERERANKTSELKNEHTLRAAAAASAAASEQASSRKRTNGRPKFTIRRQWRKAELPKEYWTQHENSHWVSKPRVTNWLKVDWLRTVCVRLCAAVLPSSRESEPLPPLCCCCRWCRRFDCYDCYQCCCCRCLWRCCGQYHLWRRRRLLRVVRLRLGCSKQQQRWRRRRLRRRRRRPQPPLRSLPPLPPLLSRRLFCCNLCQLFAACWCCWPGSFACIYQRGRCGASPSRQS